MNTEAIVAYLDVLGGKEKIKKETEEFVKKIQYIFHEAVEGLKPCVPFDREPYIKNFSDNICIAIFINHETNIFAAVRNTLDFISRIQIVATGNHIFLRGAITCEKFYQTSDIVSGKALVEAVDAEENLAIFPRVILLPNFLNLIKQDQLTNMLQCHILQIDSDGFAFVDFLGVYYFIKKSAGHEYEHLLFCAVKSLLDEYKESAENLKVKQKLIWLSTYISNSAIMMGMPQYILSFDMLKQQFSDLQFLQGNN